MIKNFVPEKFPALADLIRDKREADLTALEGVVVEYANEFRAAAETAAIELADMRLVVELARVYLERSFTTDRHKLRAALLEYDYHLATQ